MSVQLQISAKQHSAFWLLRRPSGPNLAQSGEMANPVLDTYFTKQFNVNLCWNDRVQWSGTTRIVETHQTPTRGRWSVLPAWVAALVTGRFSECSMATSLCLPQCVSCRTSTWRRTFSVSNTTNFRCRLVRKLQSNTRFVTYFWAVKFLLYRICWYHRYVCQCWLNCLCEFSDHSCSWWIAYRVVQWLSVVCIYEYSDCFGSQPFFMLLLGCFATLRPCSHGRSVAANQRWLQPAIDLINILFHLLITCFCHWLLLIDF